MQRLAGKVVIITGASRGIGKSIAEIFASEGAKLVLVSRNANRLKEFAQQIKTSAIVISGDVTKAADMEKMAHTALSTYGRIDVLCLNAGIYPSVYLSEMTESQWDEVCNTNLKGAFLAIRACLPCMKQQKYGRIVVTSSITGPKVVQPGLAHYAASKAGLNGLIKAAAFELAKDGITVNGVEPGNIMTEGLAEREPKVLNDLTRAIPMGVLGSPCDVAYAMLFLASDEAKYITGETIVVDGGQILPESSFMCENY